MAQTVRAFIDDSFQIISSSSPTVPLQGNDQSKGLQFLNELLSEFSGTGLYTPVAQKVEFLMSIGQEYVTFADPAIYPDANVTVGRLSNLQNAWLYLDGVTYPLVDESRNVFFDSYKYDPQQGLPRFCIITNEVNLTRMRVYPAPSQVFSLSVYGKFELLSFNINSTMATVPNYSITFLRLALAKMLSRYKGRSQAWTPDLEQDLIDSKKNIASVSSVNLAIQSDHDSYLNGSWRVKAGI